MNIFKKIEQSLEKLVEDKLAGAFSGEVHPIEIARRMQQKMREGRKVGPGTMYVPNLFEVALNPDDLAPLEQMGATFRRELIRYLKEQAKEDDFTFLTPPAVTFAPSKTLPRGRAEVTASYCDDAAAAIPPAGGLLAGIEGFDKGQEFQVGLGETFFGRAGGTHALGDPKASKKHFAISFGQGGFSLRDEGSRNGTFLNGRPVKEERLHNGDRIGVGYSVYEFRILED